jgi:ATP adenylyltransferase
VNLPPRRPKLRHRTERNLMDLIWTPWRYRYIGSATKEEGCIFCALQKHKDAEAFIVHRGEKNYVVLNAFPYTTGHLMVVPFQHVGDLAECDTPTLDEMMRLAQRMQVALSAVYHSDGFNLGMNLGRSAGAGVAGHIHLHLVPRWNGDANFMTTVGETRLVPEDLASTYTKLRAQVDPKQP